MNHREKRSAWDIFVRTLDLLATNVFMLALFVFIFLCAGGLFFSISLIFVVPPVFVINSVVELIPVKRDIDFMNTKIGWFDFPFLAAYLVYYLIMVKKFIYIFPYYMVRAVLKQWNEFWIETKDFILNKST